MVPIDIHPEALAELHDAFFWYEEKQPGLGHQFLVVVDASLERLRRHPRSFPVVTRGARSAVLRRFPYSVIYRFDGQVATVFAVYHGRRQPRRWADRISETIAAYARALGGGVPSTAPGAP